MDILLDQIKKEFECEGQPAGSYSPLTLAYIGDAVYEIVIRSVVVLRGNRKVNDLHKASVKYVKAETQAAIIKALIEKEMLTEEEHDIFRRGRNAKSYSAAKNASINDYRKATGFEALMGYLYLEGKMDRVIELAKVGIEAVGMEI